MPASPSSAAQAAREALAQRLGELRRDAGLTGRELAVRCGWSESKSSRIEHARTPPSDADIRAWCQACDAVAQVADLIAANRAADSLYVEWRRIHRGGMRRSQESYLPLYERTRHFRVYCSNVIPGLLQTSGYATALLSTITAFQGTPDDVADAVAARVNRSRVIREGDHRFALLVEESVLRYRIASPSVMAGQLGYLLEVMSLPSVSLGVIPFAAQRGMWPQETFMVFDDASVQVELLTAFVNVTAPGEIATYLGAFGQLQEMAVYGFEARALIARAIEALE
ncbi:helix-turn-helix domain-containing protein [Actinacidiphila glaucinigra]|uniref:helix-turn-helix domain-containing protein n=1 Tax=Actinacidiphila glaucinigra TaxID=235986 RepID=UPI0035E2FD11